MALSTDNNDHASLVPGFSREPLLLQQAPWLKPKSTSIEVITAKTKTKERPAVDQAPRQKYHKQIPKSPYPQGHDKQALAPFQLPGKGWK